ncbi:unnamed protein product [Litomosoides sigmodontis]|uniref:C2 domain-containing protein n=1 Tax=Litomosoides sigmodontis TaxID=42156 RepID=A0A3P6V3A8_LITSI|nr:unnamed protein product [Litomosoides sigmodontis]
MDGLTLLIMSWLIIGVLCYFMLVKVGAPQLAVTTEINDGMTKAKSATFSNGSGDEYFTDWLNGLIEWLFSNMNCAPDILHAWIVAMNEAAKKISIPGKFEVLFEGFSDNNSVTRAPRITDIRMQQSHNNHLIVKSNISVPEVHLKLMSSQRIGDRLLVTNFDAKITDLHGEIELRLACIANQIYMIVCFCGRPELDIELRNRDAAPTGMVSTTIVDEMIRKCLLSAVTNLSLPEIGAGQCGRMGSNVVPSSTSTAFSTISRLITTNVDRPDVIDSVDSLPAAAPQTQTTHEMLKRMNQSTFLANHHAKAQAIPNKMRVKVIRAQRLGGDRLVNQPYVVLEMDEPAQKFQTKYGLNSSPFWDETFDFDLTSASEEILFEIYEGCSSSSSTLIEQATGYRGQHEVENDQFLGLAIVGLNEVRHCNANTLHTLKLQGRPYRNDVITGDLTAQFDFYYDPVSNSIGKNAKQTASDHQFPELVNRPKRSTYDPSDSFGAYNGHDVLSTMEAIGTTKSITQIYDSHGEQIGSADMQQQQHIITPQQQSSGMNERHEYATGQYQPRGSATTSQMQQHMIPSNSTGTTSTHHLPTETNITDVDNYPYHGYDKQEAEGLLKSKSDEMPQTQEVSENRQSRGNQSYAQ